MTTKTKRRTTKKAQLIQMLSTRTGADVEVISGKRSWQSHSTRAVITMLKKAGFKISTEKSTGKPTRYRIIAGPQDAPVAGGEGVAEQAITAPETDDVG